MKTRIVLTALMATLMLLEVSAQVAEYDDMYFRGKDREKHKALVAYEGASDKRSQKLSAQEALDEDYYANPTDSYSARNVNPEYISRSNSELASDEEAMYYSEEYQPASANATYNNSYYNNTNWARRSFYANSMWGRPYGMGMYGMGFYDPWMNPYYGGGFYDPWMMPAYGYGFGPSYGWRSGWSVSLMYGNAWGPWGFGNSYYGGYGWNYPAYYYGGGYVESSRINYGKRPSRHSAVTRPTQRQRTQGQIADNNTAINGRNRARQTQEDYYVRPSRRTSSIDNPTTPARNSSNSIVTPSTQPSRSRDFNTPRESRSPSFSPSPSRSTSSPSRSTGGSSGGSSRPRGRG